MDQSTGEALLVNGQKVTGSAAFTPDKADGTIDISFTFDASALAGKSVVAFETVTLSGKTVAVHTDINDEGQTVHFPEIQTTAIDNATKDHISNADEEMTIVDTVKYSNLVKGKKYTVNGTLMDKETGKALLDKKGKEVTASTTFTAETADGTVELTFKLDGSLLAGKTLVAFEDVLYEGISVGTHADITDEEQTVYVPKIGTTALDEESGTHNSMADSPIIIRDTVKYENLIPGKEYKIKGILKDKSTGETVQAKVAEGMKNAALRPGKIYTLTKGSYVYVAEGSDGVEAGIYREAEGGYIPYDAGEDAAAIQIGKELISWAGTFEKDTQVQIDEQTDSLYDINKITYTMSKEDKEVVSEKTFTPQSANGTVDVTFIFDGSDMAGRTIIVFEELYYNEEQVASHTDLTDEGQTIYVPEIHTTAKDAVSGTQNALASKTVKIVDTVDYKNLLPGKEYTVSGKLYDKSTGEALLIDGKEVTGETVFTPEKAEGSVEVIFEFDGSALKNQTVVAFENIYIDGKQVAAHADINDKEQSIYFPEIKTTATDQADGDHEVAATKNVTITDMVEYANLIPGETYKLSGKLMDKETGKELVVNGKAVTGEAEFTAEKGSGSVEVEITFDATGLGGRSVVVFEKLYTADGTEVANHEDIHDEGQTVKFKVGTLTPNMPNKNITKGGAKTGDNMNLQYLLIMMATVTLTILAMWKRICSKDIRGEAEIHEQLEKKDSKKQG